MGLIFAPIGAIIRNARTCPCQATFRMTPHKTTPHKSRHRRIKTIRGTRYGERVFVVTSVRQAGLAMKELMGAGAVGFDTESKPTFKKGQKSEGPHAPQFATLEKAFIFQSYFVESHPAIIELLQIDRTHQNRLWSRRRPPPDLKPLRHPPRGHRGPLRSFKTLWLPQRGRGEVGHRHVLPTQTLEIKIRHHLELGGEGLVRAPVALRCERCLRRDQDLPCARGTTQEPLEPRAVGL